MSKKLAYALHTIERKNGAGEIETVQPDTIFVTTEQQFKELAAMRAVREPNEAETALYEKQNGLLAAKAAEEPKGEPEGESGAKEPKASAKATGGKKANRKAEDL